MKKIKMTVCSIIMMIMFCIPVLADTYTMGCNTSRGLRYGSASTSCTNTFYSHSYTTSGTASSLNHRISVYVATTGGYTMASNSSTSSTRYASATWNADTSTAHKHAASSNLFMH